MNDLASQEKVVNSPLIAIIKKKKPVEVYLETGFENLSHFSYAFKKQFGMTPTALAELFN
jgi:AraC-like DNA-binding protein